MPRPVHPPLEPLPDPAHEAYVQRRAQGMGPTEAAAAVGLVAFKLVERHASFRGRLEALLRSAAEHDPTITLDWLVVELKRTVASARGSGQHKNANEAIARLEGLYERYPHLRGDVPAAAASAEVAKQEAAKPGAKLSRLERRMAHRANLSAVPEPAAGEGA